MAMTTFTEAFQQARKVFQSQKFANGDTNWEKFLKAELNIPQLLGSTGLNPSYASAPEKLRKTISGARGTGLAVLKRLFTGEGDIIWDASGPNDGHQSERAAAIKFVRHIYRASKRGAQDVWVFNPPKGHEKFVFDLVKGTSGDCRSTLNKTSEIFRDDEMRHMSGALAVALAAAQKAAMKLNAPDDDIRRTVRRWFCDDHGSDAQLGNAMKVLKAGVPKIVNACNANSLVFADDPTSRASRKTTYGLAVPGGEGGGFPVIYLEGLFTRMSGNSGKIWLCAETIVHELSHVVQSTQDHFYDDDGLKPTSNRFPSAKALENADSWGYFVIDADGKLSDADRQRIVVAPK